MGSSTPERGFDQELVTALPRLRAFARSLAGDAARADDLVQETATKALANRDKYNPGTRLEAWLITILRNTYYSQKRKSWREVEDGDGTIASAVPEPSNQEARTEVGDLMRALAGLADEQREALILTAAAGFSYEEAAEICGTMVGTIKSRVARGRQQLDAILDGEEALPPHSAAIEPADLFNRN